MNTTIYYRPRQSGKTTDLVRALKELHPSDEVLFLTANQQMANYLFQQFPELKTYLKVKVASYHCKALETALKGYRPEVIFIDNAEWIEDKSIQHLRGLFRSVKELYISGTGRELIKYKLPMLLDGVD